MTITLNRNDMVVPSVAGVQVFSLNCRKLNEGSIDIVDASQVPDEYQKYIQSDLYVEDGQACGLASWFETGGLVLVTDLTLFKPRPPMVVLNHINLLNERLDKVSEKFKMAWPINRFADCFSQSGWKIRATTNEGKCLAIRSDATCENAVRQWINETKQADRYNKMTWCDSS